jgi:hypothetical protein
MTTVKNYSASPVHSKNGTKRCFEKELFDLTLLIEMPSTLIA